MTDSIDEKREEYEQMARDMFSDDDEAYETHPALLKDTDPLTKALNVTLQDIGNRYEAMRNKAQLDELTAENTLPVTHTERHGHPRFYELLDELADLHSRKNHDYAAGGNPLGNFQRRGDLYSRYPGLNLSDPVVVALVDMQKQLDAALWFCSNGHTAGVEGKIDRLRDVACYAILAMIMEEEKLLFETHV